MWSAKALTIDEKKVPFLETGDPHSPHVLLLVHAFPVGMRMWETVAVPDGWRAVAPALPGFDGTDPPPADSTSIDDYARYVLAFVDALRVDNAVLGGLSMGGYVSFALWRLERLRWRGLVLADTRAGADSEQARAGREQMLATVKAQGTHGVAEAMLPKLLGATTRSRRSEVVDHVRRLIERQTSEGVAAAIVRLRDRPDSTALLRDVGVPALVIVGEEDEVTPPKESEAMQSALQDARLERIAEAGHLSCVENAQAFNAALASYLSAIRR
jgi:pimeloyl-ACP methyl ester carboxylesterase